MISLLLILDIHKQVHVYASLNKTKKDRNDITHFTLQQIFHTQ